jgi:hypothetical protein
VLARECPSPYSLASWQLHHTERCWCSTPAAACTERRALRCHWVGTARCRCVPALADDHATPCWLLQPHASNESSASRPAGRPPAPHGDDGRGHGANPRPRASLEAHAACVQAPPRRPPAGHATGTGTGKACGVAPHPRAHAHRRQSSPVPIATKAPAGRGRFVRW